MMNQLKISVICVAMMSLSACMTTPVGLQNPLDASPMDGSLMGARLASLTIEEQSQALEREYEALSQVDAGQSVDWHSKNGAISGVITPGQTYYVGSQNCRQYNYTLVTNGQSEHVRGSACRNSDGSWTPLT